MLRAVALALCLAAPLAQAADLYVWTDRDGRRQISDVVPPQYATRAKRVQVPEAPQPSAASGGSAAPAPLSRPATNPVASQAECETHWESYRNSLDCLAFFEGAPPEMAARGRATCAAVPPPPATCAPAPGLSSR